MKSEELSKLLSPKLLQPSMKCISCHLKTDSLLAGQYTSNVLDILNFLQERYGKISHSQLLSFKQEVTNFVFDPLTPVENVFNKVEDLMDYGELAKIPYLQQHQIIFKACNIFNETEN